MTKEDIEARLNFSKQSSMLHWWPRVKDLPIPQLDTHCVEVDAMAMHQMAYEGTPMPAGLVEGVQRFCDYVGYPAFIRTDHLSGKHSWEYTCYLAKRKDISRHIAQLAEETAMADWMGDVTFNAVFVRQFLDLKTAGFTAFYGGFPVNREVRCFVRDGQLECFHRYWFNEVFEHEVGEGLPADWRKRLKHINTLKPADEALLLKHAETVGKLFPGEYWSVDFAQGTNDIWYLIDMARGELSYHLPACDYAPEEQP